MANSKSNIYPIQLQGAELNLNKLDAEIKQYSGFNKNNSPFVGGCLSNVFHKEEQITGGNAENTYIDENGDVFQVTTEGLFKNDEKVLDIYADRLYDIEELDLKYDVVECFDEYLFVYAVGKSDGFAYYLKYYDFNSNQWHTKHLINFKRYSSITFSLKRIKSGDKYFILASYRHEDLSTKTKDWLKYYIIASVKDGETVKTGEYESEETPQTNYFKNDGISMSCIHGLYNNTLDKLYVCFFPGVPFQASGGLPANTFCFIYSVTVTVSDTVSFSVNLDADMKTVTGDCAVYCDYQDGIAEGDFIELTSTGNVKYISYYATDKKLWAFNYRKSTAYAPRMISRCEYCIIPDDTVGIKIQFSKPLYFTFEQMADSNPSQKRQLLFKFGIIDTFPAAWTNIQVKTGICDFICHAMTASNDNLNIASYFNVGAILNDIVLLNNEVVTGLTLPDTQGILISDWNSVNQNKIFCLNYNHSNYDFKQDSVVIYQANNIFYKVKRVTTPKLRLVNNQIVVNCDAEFNAYRIKDGIKLLFAPSWNNRFYFTESQYPSGDVGVSNRGYAATSINEYNLDDNASLLLNPVPINKLPNITVNQRDITNKLPNLINLYQGETAEIKYVGSSFTKDFTDVYNDATIEGLPFPIDTNGNVQYSPSLFTEVKNTYGNHILVKSGKSYYPLMIGNNNEAVMSFYLASGLDNFEEGFIIQGQFYGIIGSGLYTVQYANGVVSGTQFIVDVSNLQFVGNTPYEALFFSKTNRCLYSFTGANVLNQKQLVDKISEVRNYLYNPATQTVFLITDIGVLFYGLFGMFLLEYTDITNIFLLDNGIVMSDNSGNYRYIKYYLDEGDEGYTKENIRLETCFYGMNNEVVTINDCLYFRLFSEEHEEGDLKVKATTISLKGRQTEETTFKIKASDWDKITHTIYLRYQPKTQRGLGVSFSIDSPFKIASMSVGSQPDAVLVDRVSKGAITAPSVTTNNNEW